MGLVGGAMVLLVAQCCKFIHCPLNLTSLGYGGGDDGCGLEMMVVERWCCWWRGGDDDGCGLEMMVVERWCR
uniref:Secreted protein n=1 Tax=Tanacetum cinerariifolium TaxID=118510 RepID=A0A699QFG5_TANCI|nr:hypothetical protein [Tanacetum cinerariifolium]